MASANLAQLAIRGADRTLSYAYQPVNVYRDKDNDQDEGQPPLTEIALGKSLIGSAACVPDWISRARACGRPGPADLCAVGRAWWGALLGRSPGLEFDLAGICALFRQTSDGPVQIAMPVDWMARRLAG